MSQWSRKLKNKRGQSAMEYVLIVSVAAVMTYTLVSFYYALFDEGLLGLGRTLKVLLVSGNGFYFVK